MIDELLAALPEAARKHLATDGPLPLRMMAAKGLAPLPPRELIIVLAGLAHDATPAIRTLASATLAALPEAVLLGGLQADVPGAALQALVGPLQQRAPILRAIMLNKATPDAAVAAVAKVAKGELLDVIAGNQERCLRSQDLVDALRTNPELSHAVRDNLFDLLVRSGVFYDGMVEYDAALQRLTPTERIQAADKVPLPLAVQTGLNESDADAKDIASALEDPTVGAEEKQRRVPMLKLISGLLMSQRIAFALKGNKEVRTILVRDHNRMVATAAMRNPRITEGEILATAQSRGVHDDVIRIIANDREMTRQYAVKRALAFNPKTPLAAAMHCMSLLQEKDIRDLSKSKNVSQAIANHARRMLAQKQKK